MRRLIRKKVTTEISDLDNLNPKKNNLKKKIIEKPKKNLKIEKIEKIKKNVDVEEKDIDVKKEEVETTN